MGRTKTGRPSGRPRTVALNEPTDAEARMVATCCLLWEENRRWPLVGEVAVRCEWTKQRASALAKRLVDKGLVALNPIGASQVEVQVVNYKPSRPPS